jgi:hypothetical protein
MYAYVKKYMYAYVNTCCPRYGTSAHTYIINTYTHMYILTNMHACWWQCTSWCGPGTYSPADCDGSGDTDVARCKLVSLRVRTNARAHVRGCMYSRIRALLRVVAVLGYSDCSIFDGPLISCSVTGVCIFACCK